MEQSQADRIEEIYIKYKEILNPLILNYEVIAAEFPIEILNEIRSIFSHFSKLYDIEISEEDLDKHIRKAENHLKRAILDGFKYNCMAYQEKASKFADEFKSVFAYINNGKFIEDFYKQERVAEDLYLKAKVTECESGDVDKSYSAYQDACNAYCELNKLIQDNFDNLHKMSAMEAATQEKKYRKSRIANIVMGALTGISIIVTIISFFL